MVAISCALVPPETNWARVADVIEQNPRGPAAVRRVLHVSLPGSLPGHPRPRACPRPNPGARLL